eukprot:890465_1
MFQTPAFITLLSHNDLLHKSDELFHIGITTANHLLLYEDCVAYITQNTSFSENQINSLIHQIQNINHESLCLEPSESFLFHSDIDPIIHSPIPGNHDARMDSPNPSHRSSSTDTLQSLQ